MFKPFAMKETRSSATVKDSNNFHHHGVSQWFVKGHIPKGSQGNSLLYGSDPNTVKGKNHHNGTLNCTKIGNYAPLQRNVI